jgi:hypothetical protein
MSKSEFVCFHHLCDLELTNPLLLIILYCICLGYAYTGSTDPEFDDYQRHFGVMEQATEKLIKDTKAFSEAVIGRLFFLLQYSRFRN